MASESSGEAGDGGRRAVEEACDLAVGRTGDQRTGDGAQELGTFEEVGRGERLSPEGAAAGQTEEARDGRAAAPAVGAVSPEAVPECPPEVVGTIAPRAERRDEASHPFHEGVAKIHTGGKGRKRAWLRGNGNSLARKEIGTLPSLFERSNVRRRTNRGPDAPQHSAHHHGSDSGVP